MEKAFCRSLADGRCMIVTAMLPYEMMVIMKDIERINKARPKANISIDLMSEQERLIKVPKSQKK